MDDKYTSINKWRLILGHDSARELSFHGEYTLGTSYETLEEMLDYLYEREHGDGVRRGGMEGSRLYAAQWITKVRNLFPKSTAEILEKHALEHFHMTELLTDKEVLSKMQPNMELLKTILAFKHLMKGEVLEEAKKIAKKVADELKEKLEQDIRKSFLGKIDRNSTSNVKSMRNLDIKRTIRRNLKNYDTDSDEIVLKQVYFNNRVRKYNQWKIIIAIDESGSMLDSVIYSAVMAGIFARLPMLDTKLVIFDTQVVDLSGYVDDPVEVLMGMQLGGGTNIGGALSYCEELMENPNRTMVVMVTDLCEGGSVKALLGVSKDIIESGAKLIFLTALDADANPSYDKENGQMLRDMGAFVGAMTPEHLGDYIGKLMK